jgi:hypothetical protein
MARPQLRPCTSAVGEGETGKKNNKHETSAEGSSNQPGGHKLLAESP